MWSCSDGRRTVRPPVLALGEAKHTNEKRSTSDLTRLERLRNQVASNHPSAADAKLLLFSACGFDRDLKTAAKRSDVELIDMERLFRGQ